MLRDDYLLRLIEQVGRVLARVREMLLGGEVVREAEVKQAAAVAGMDLGMLRALTVESVPALVNPSGRPDGLRCVLIAEVLFADALVARTRGDVAGEVDRMTKVEALLSAAEQDAEGAHRLLIAGRIAALRELMRQAAPGIGG
ncbi:MAG: hypothetical protein ACRENP_01680 [Longimicrobiales bacterium]